MKEEQEQSPPSSEEEEEEEAEETMALDTDTQEALLTFAKNSGTMSKYPTWRRTLLRHAREEEMKRFCKAQAVQRRLHETETAVGELEAKGTKVELALRSQSEQQKAQWLEQLLPLVQKNSLLAEEAELVLTVKLLDLEEQQCEVDQELQGYMNQEETVKTPADRQAEEQLLKKLLDVVSERDEIIRF